MSGFEFLQNPEELPGNNFTTTQSDSKLLDVQRISPEEISIHINNETHTLGNLLAQQLAQCRSVKFAGYRKHHPLDNFIELRIILNRYRGANTAQSEEKSPQKIFGEQIQEGCCDILAKINATRVKLNLARNQKKARE